MIWRRCSKYRNRKTEVDGYTFASKAEAQRFRELRLMEHAGEITHLELQPKYSIKIGSVHVCDYYPDFRYLNRHGDLVVEDVKGVRTAAFSIKAKLMKACFGTTVVEISNKRRAR